MVFNEISFNQDYWKTKTEAEFIEQEKHHGLSVEQMKEAFALMGGKPGKVDEVITDDENL